MSAAETKRGPRQAKLMVEAIKGELLHKLDLSEEEFSTARTRRAMTARQRMAVIAHEVLIDSMSNTDIAELLGIRRTTYVQLRQNFKQGKVFSP
jgi:CRP-like cAMP-binding protein